jgi:hypothetical protein
MSIALSRLLAYGAGMSETPTETLQAVVWYWRYRCVFVEYEPAEEGYTPTYSVLGCRVAKRGKIVGRFDFTTDGQTFRRSQVLDHVDGQT